MDLLDTEPLFGDRESESTVGEAFRSGYPDSVMVATKCILGTTRRKSGFGGVVLTSIQSAGNN